MKQMSEETQFEAYITKYALTDGITKKTATVSSSYPDMIVIVGSEYRTTFHGKDWHRTEAEAIKRAEEMRRKKIASVKKSLAKLEALTFALSEHDDLQS